MRYKDIVFQPDPMPHKLREGESTDDPLARTGTVVMTWEDESASEIAGVNRGQFFNWMDSGYKDSWLPDAVYRSAEFDKRNWPSPAEREAIERLWAEQERENYDEDGNPREILASAWGQEVWMSFEEFLENEQRYGTLFRWHDAVWYDAAIQSERFAKHGKT